MSLTTLEKLTSLTLQDIALTMPFVSQLARNAQLSALNFEETNFSDEMAIKLTNMPNLQKLVVGATKLTSKGLQTICSMNDLRELDIWAADIRDTDLAELTKLQNLKYLSLGGYEG